MDSGAKSYELITISLEATYPGCFVTRHSYVFQMDFQPGTYNMPGSSSRNAHVTPQEAPATSAEPQ